ncbi:DUF3553 domain-containing protein [Caldovatus sp. SYSU G05006]|uniref:DUF3553 domain-containing protein n=2 Tax=Caldovatus aquaticus TaxID=2865671 RepID=A0ABS7EYH5_9PROT|nr:DUF3553 domain-containing protein [Caldovatus aquaticus]
MVRRNADRSVSHLAPSPGGPVPALIEPGMRVRHSDRPDWGVGQVQSVIGDRITVNFEHAGKVLINATRISLQILDDSDA